VATTTLGGERSISNYQWLVLASAFLGWMFDSMDLNLFTLVLFPSVSQLLHSANPGEIARTGGYIMAIKLVAWGLGGIFFGVVADRIGRSRTLVLTILIYSIFTGLSGLAQSWIQLAVMQAIAGFGIGGEWSAGAALVVETWPEKHRARVMQFMQMAFSFGFFVAALDNLFIGPIGGWRWVLVLGALPAVLTLLVRRFVPEPERWLKVRRAAGADGTGAGTFRAIFKPAMRRNTIVGVIISTAMMIGAWGGLTLLPSWIQQLLGPAGASHGVQTISYAFMLMNIGGVGGYLTLMWLTDAVGRRWSYFLFCGGALIAALYLFLFIRSLDVLLWYMLPYGFLVVGGFGTFAAYLPELFPTRVRATGQGFCWNAARMLTGIGPFIGGIMVGAFGSFPAAMASTAVFFAVGLVAIWFGPETRGLDLKD
jgi:MFS family permease